MDNIWKNRNFSPMLLEEINKPFNNKDYIFELKFDGIRTIIFINSKNIQIQSRNKNDITYLFPELKDITKQIKSNVIFDGEIISFENGKPSFSKLSKRLHLKNKKKILEESINNPVSFIAFDILYQNKTLTDLPLMERKKYLDKYKDSDFFTKVKFVDTEGINLFKSIKKLGLEGIVAKKKSSLYYINQRTDDFIKIKNKNKNKFLIGGYKIKKNDIISLSLGEYKNSLFLYVGKVSINKKSKIYNQIINEEESKNYFNNYNENINYIKPTISCTVEYLERTENNHLRHPIYKDN